MRSEDAARSSLVSKAQMFYWFFTARLQPLERLSYDDPCEARLFLFFRAPCSAILRGEGLLFPNLDSPESRSPRILIQRRSHSALGGAAWLHLSFVEDHRDQRCP